MGAPLTYARSGAAASLKPEPLAGRTSGLRKHDEELAIVEREPKRLRRARARITNDAVALGSRNSRFDHVHVAVDLKPANHLGSALREGEDSARGFAYPTVLVVKRALLGNRGRRNGQRNDGCANELGNGLL